MELMFKVWDYGFKSRRNCLQTQKRAGPNRGPGFRDLEDDRKPAMGLLSASQTKEVSHRQRGVWL